MTVLRVLLIRAVYSNPMEIRIDETNTSHCFIFQTIVDHNLYILAMLDSRHDISIMWETTLVNGDAKATEADHVPFTMKPALRLYSEFVTFGTL